MFSECEHFFLGTEWRYLLCLYNCWVSLGRGFPGGSVVKNPPGNAGDAGSIPGSGISPGRGNDNPFQYSCLENPMDRGAWWATVRGVSKSQTLSQTEQLSASFGQFYFSREP